MSGSLRRDTTRDLRMDLIRDSEIEQWVLRELKMCIGVRSRELCVFARNGVVNLRGSVETLQEKLAVEQAASCANGVTGVVNELKVEIYTMVIEDASSALQLAQAHGPGMSVQPIAVRRSHLSHAAG